MAEDWASVYAELHGRVADLSAGDLDRLAVAAYLLGRDDESARAFERAHAAYASAGALESAARAAYWLGVTSILRGEMAPASGWMARAARDATDAGDGSTRAMLLVPDLLGALDEGDASRADAVSLEMLSLLGDSTDHDARALVAISRGQALLAGGRCGDAMRVFDEVMVAVTSNEVSPIPSGLVYCAVIDACMQSCDVRRASEWTDALARWCDEQPGLVPYRGQCLVHRSQVLQFRGAWAEAMVEAENAQRHLSNHPALGMALYQAGDLFRLRGEFSDAERLYRLASEHGRDPRPGLALLRLAEGNADAAAATVRRMLQETTAQLDRSQVLAAAVDVLLAVGDLDAARAAADELRDLAITADATMLRAMADYAAGCVLLASGNAADALASLRRAADGWREVGITYDGARARVKIAAACAALGDADVASFERDAARGVFASLGALPDVAAIDSIGAAPRLPITDREVEVLRLVASGKTNRDIATTLVISEHTVGRHLQNIFLKLDISSRAAATAYAYENGLM